MATAVLVRKTDHAVNARSLERLVAEGVLNLLRGIGGAINGADDGDIVASAGSSVGPRITHESALGQQRDIGEIIQRGRKLEFALLQVELQVVLMDQVANVDVPAGRADVFAILEDSRAFRDLSDGDFVTGTNALVHLDLTVSRGCLESGGKRNAGDHDVVVWIQEYKRLVGG